MKKIFVFTLILLFFPIISAAGDWKDILKEKHICTDCEKKALLIAIGHYKNADNYNLKNLNGPENDIIKIQEGFLMPVLFYRVNEILVLEDHEATKDNIISIMENWFLKGEDVKERFFYFSGHGSQIYDDNGDESDDRDEVILSYDAEFDKQKSLKIETVVMDDEIGKWFEKLRGKRLVAMFDSCYSGTMTRNIGSFSDSEFSASRFVDSAIRGRLTGDRTATNEKPGITEDNIPENHVYFYASRSFQAAKEDAFENRKIHGCFSKALITAVKNISARTSQNFGSRYVSYMELFTEIETVMKNEMNLEQSPDIQPSFRGTSPEKYYGTDSVILLTPFFTISPFQK